MSLSLQLPEQFAELPRLPPSPAIVTVCHGVSTESPKGVDALVEAAMAGMYDI